MLCTCRISFVLLVLAAGSAFAREGAENWVQVQSPHFVVLSDSSEKQARHVAGQFERMRGVFHTVFPRAPIDPAEPILVIAVKDKKTFEGLEPEAYLGKGQAELGGLFLHAPEKNYILLHLEAQGVHPYAAIYHEYTHLLLSGDDAWLPLWLNEGLAQFFQNTDIHEKEADAGEPSHENIMLLRQNKLIPIETLLAVDAKSPYYHQEDKASIFYAESWALVHMLKVTDETLHTRRLQSYAEMVSQHVDAVTAGERAFGDLPQFQKALEMYISSTNYSYMKIAVPQDVNEASFETKPVPPAEADAVRADFLAYDGRVKEARALLDGVLREDPKNVSAHETMGYLEGRAGNLEAARKWYEEAVELDSASYLTHYYYAVISMQGGAGPASEKIEASLQMAIKLNPKFAPAYDALAILYETHHEKLDEAHMMSLRAASLDPGKLRYRLDTAAILQKQNRYKDAIIVLKSSAGLAKTPEEAATLESRIRQIEEYQASHAQTEAPARQARPEYTGEAATPAKKTVTLPAPKHPAETPHGQKITAQGVIQDVQCTDSSTIELKIEGNGKTISLYSDNYYDIPFSASNFTPEGEIHPCTDLKGIKASIQYFATADKTVDGQILSIELNR